MTKPLRQISATELRIRAGEYLDRAHLGHEAFLISRGQRGKAVLLSASDYVDLTEELAAFKEGRKPPTSRGALQPKTLTQDQLKNLVK